MQLVASGRLDPTVFATHRFALGDTMAAYDTFADAATTDALKVVLEGSELAHRHERPRRHEPRTRARLNPQRAAHQRPCVGEPACCCGAHGFDPRAEGVETPAEPAIVGVADVDRTRKLSRSAFARACAAAHSRSRRARFSARPRMRAGGRRDAAVVAELGRGPPR